MHLWSHKVRYALEGVCGKEIHYFSFCLTLLCAAQQLKGSDQPTITIHNGFSASSTSLEACLRSGLSPCAPPSSPHPPVSSLYHPLMSVSVCVHVRVDGYVCVSVFVWNSGPWLWLWQRKTPLKSSGVSQCDQGPLSLSDHATAGAPGPRIGAELPGWMLWGTAWTPCWGRKSSTKKRRIKRTRALFLTHHVVLTCKRFAGRMANHSSTYRRLNRPECSATTGHVGYL